MERKYFEWEKKVEELDRQIGELKKLSSVKGINFSAEIRELGKERVKELKAIYGNLSAWQTVQVARHENRPVMKDYLEGMVKDFREMHGDRCFGDDRAVVCGYGRIGRYRVMVIGNNKRGIKLSMGSDEVVNNDKLRCYGGYSNPEGFRKALAKMKLAEKFGIPVVTLIDTPGAYPGIGAEERGQGNVIAVNLEYMSLLKVPIVSVLIGEGGSGGALGLCGGANRFGALEHSYYSVISPEGGAAILWRDASEREKAAEALRLSAREGYKLGAIDDIICEPLGGAHRNHRDTIDRVRKYIVKGIKEFKGMSGDKLVTQRFEMINKRAGKFFREKKKGFFRRG